MKKGFPLFILSLAIIAVAGACVSKGPAPEDGELTFRLITPKEAASKFSVDDAPNPFTARILALTTLPSNFLTAALHVPKTVGQVEVLDLAVFSEDGEMIAEAATKLEMTDYWKMMTVDTEAMTKQMEAIERYYLPGNNLTGKKLGKEYAVVFLSKVKYKPTDLVEARFLIDGQEKVFTYSVSSVLADPKK